MFCRQIIRTVKNNRPVAIGSIQSMGIKSHSCPCKITINTRLLTTKFRHQTRNYSNNTENRAKYTSTNSNVEQHSRKTLIPSEELLERLIAGLSTDIHQKNRVYKNDLMRVINRVEEMNFSTKKQSLLLLSCCADLLPDETSSTRLGLAELIWKTVKPHTNFTVEHYNALLRVYISNNKPINVSSFINMMAPVKPNITTYELIIRTLSEAGDLNQATEVLSNMKSQNLPATENIFNSLIICQGKAQNLQNIQEILTMMKSLKLEPTSQTYTSIASAYAWNKKDDIVLEKMTKAKEKNIQFKETHIMEIVKILATMSSYGIIPRVLQFLPQETLNTPSISAYMQSVCTWLVFQNHPIAALEIYKCLPLPSFGPKDDRGLHGRSLVRDCVKANMPSSVIGLVTQELMASGRNPIALHNATEAALQLGKVPLALDMLTRMQQLGMPLRPHYFWPILLQSSKSYGEKGIMNTLSTMVKMDVKPDHETVVEYILPFVSFTSPQNLMKKFTETGLSVTTVLTPMMESLLNTGQVRAASEICELFQGKVEAEKILIPLVKGYLLSGDTQSTIHILEDVSNKATENKDWVGRFLCCFMRHKKIKEDLSDLLTILQGLKKANMKISTSASDYCVSRLPEKYDQMTVDKFKSCLADVTDDHLVDEGDMFTHQIPHPKNMNEESLRGHLNELEAKNMNTRGVLRKLLQKYCRDGNLKAAREIVEKCEKEGVFLSAGMKASIFDLHVKLGELDLAEMTLADLNKSSPNFTLDEFKVIDFATLMVYRKKFDQAVQLLTEQAKKRRIQGGRGIVQNCWRLLEAAASTGTPKDVQTLSDTLTSLRYCSVSNKLLGPSVRVYLKDNKLDEAVAEYSRLAAKFKVTPLKHELLCRLLTAMSEGHGEERFLVHERCQGPLYKLAQKVLDVDRNVHGPGDVQLTLIAALADVGYKKSLRKLFLDPAVKFHPDALMRRCERFADEKKIDALECIAECARDLRRLDIEQIYDLMLDVYQREDDYHGAQALWTRMQENDVRPSQKFVRNICSLLKANNQVVPSELTVLLGKQETRVNV